MKFTPRNDRARGRPRTRSLDDVIDDVRKMHIRNWMTAALNKALWKSTVDEAKAHPGL